MQKIQFYLVPNKITVTTDRVGFNTEYRQVYQRQLKLYKGIDNTIQLEVRNSEQRKETVAGKSAIVKFFDAEHKNLFTATADAIPSQIGQMSLTIHSDTISNIDPQMLRMAAYLTDGTAQSPIYIDGQFELFGNVQLMDGYNDKRGFGEIIDIAKVFNYEHDKDEYTSEIVQFGNYINDDYSTQIDSTVIGSVEIEIVPNTETPYIGFVKVYATNDKSTAFGTTWKLLESVEVTAGATSVTQIIDNTGYRYMRFSFPKNASADMATFNISKTGTTYAVEQIVFGGTQYEVGDKIRIPGSSLGGSSPSNDLTLTVTLVEGPVMGSLASYTRRIAGVSIMGIASLDTADRTFENVAGQGFTGLLDKIIVRN
jgi:hypothetical protein